MSRTRFDVTLTVWAKSKLPLTTPCYVTLINLFRAAK